jgi:uridine kinase
MAIAAKVFKMIPLDFIRHPVFKVGLVLRILLIIFCVPWVQTEWFVPFLTQSFSNPSFDPWTTFLSRGGDSLAFPYGPIMFLSYFPLVLSGWLLDGIFSTEAYSRIGFGLTNLLFDCALVFLLRHIPKGGDNRILYLYWCSPIALYISFWYGQADIVPVTFMLASLVALKNIRVKLSGLLLGFAICSKISMIIALPFFLIFMINNKKMHSVFGNFLVMLAGSVILLQAPYFFSEGVKTMVLGSREMDKIYFLAVTIYGNVQVYLVPLVYLATLYGAWRLGRMNLELLFSCIGVSFLIILILTPASVGWYLWALPFLVIHSAGQGLSLGILTVFFFGIAPLNSPGSVMPLLGLDFSESQKILRGVFSERFISLWQTSLTAINACLMWQLVREGIRTNDYYRLSRKPLIIAIAGDSGSGKDTLNSSLTNILGAEAVADISGDDYHIWDRHAPMWKVMTHLDPRANHLFALRTDILALIDGKRVLSRKYDHSIGRFAKSTMIQKNDFLIVSGLHTLYIPSLLDKMDIKVFLDMDEKLREYLKISRDVIERGKDMDSVLASLRQRAPDRDLYINTQKENADIIFKLQPINYDQLQSFDPNAVKNAQLKLKIILKNGVYCENLVRVFIGILGMRIDMKVLENCNMVEFNVEGNAHSESIKTAAKMLVPHLDELLGLKPKWDSGMLGIMQLVVLMQIATVLQERR